MADDFGIGHVVLSMQHAKGNVRSWYLVPISHSPACFTGQAPSLTSHPGEAWSKAS